MPAAMPSLALVRRRAALIAVCAVRALSTTSERLRQLGRHASIEIAPRQATRYAELAKARPSAPRTVFVNFVDTEDEHFAAVEAACAVLKEAGLDPVPHVPASRVKNAAVKRLRALRDAGAASALIIAGNDWTDICARVDDVAACAAALLDMRPVFAGFPEGHPYVPRGGARLAEKAARARRERRVPVLPGPALRAGRVARRDARRRGGDLRRRPGPGAAGQAAPVLRLVRRRAERRRRGGVRRCRRGRRRGAGARRRRARRVPREHSIDDASVRLHLRPCGGVERCLAYVEGLCSGNNS